MRTRLAALAALALVAAGCGGAKDVSDATELVPADAIAYVHVGGRVPPPGAFPFAPKEYRELHLPRLRPPVDVALLPEGWVAFRRARVKGARRIRGFSVIAQTKAALDAVRHVRVPLATAPRYLAAKRTLTGAPLSAYLREGAAWRTLEVTDSSVALHYRVRTRTPALTGVRVPADAVAAVGTADGEPPRAAVPVLHAISSAVGLDLTALLHALGGPAYAYLEPSDLVPRVSVVAAPRDPARARRDVGRMLLRIGRLGISPSASLDSVDLGPMTVVYGLEGRRLVISTDTTNAADRPVDGLPDRVLRFAYVRGAAATIGALAPALGLRRPGPRPDFLLYESRAGGILSRVVELAR